MPQNPSLDRTTHLLFELSRILQQAMTQRLKDERLNLMQLHVLFFIQENEGITMKELAMYLKITSPSATSFVNRLVRLGWVKRKQDPKNRKLVRLSVTSAGQAIIREKMKDKQHVISSIFSLLNTQDQRELNRIFESLLTSYKSSRS